MIDANDLHVLLSKIDGETFKKFEANETEITKILNCGYTLDVVIQAIGRMDEFRTILDQRTENPAPGDDEDDENDQEDEEDESEVRQAKPQKAAKASGKGRPPGSWNRPKTAAECKARIKKEEGKGDDANPKKLAALKEFLASFGDKSHDEPEEKTYPPGAWGRTGTPKSLKDAENRLATAKTTKMKRRLADWINSHRGPVREKTNKDQQRAAKAGRPRGDARESRNDSHKRQHATA